MNNLSSYCGLSDARMRASEKDLPVLQELRGYATPNPPWNRIKLAYLVKVTLRMAVAWNGARESQCVQSHIEVFF